MEQIAQHATREAGLGRLEAFMPKAAAYSRRRNYDGGPGAHEGVSLLSPYLRSRLVLEEESVAAALERFAPSSVEKFVQEVCWRTYFKGWLEMRPAVWADYCRDRDRLADAWAGDRLSLERWEAAEAGRTGIECFDAWSRELVETGYLHNHARMWFASIWVFTLRLPWQLGAAFFLKHLLDGDAASNTLGWRWVSGLHTKGKHYVARAANIAKYTEGRFQPAGRLNEQPEPLTEAVSYPRQALPDMSPPTAGSPVALLLGDDDCGPLPERLSEASVSAVAALSPTLIYPDTWYSEKVRHFRTEAVRDAAERLGKACGASPAWVAGEEGDPVAALHAWFEASGASRIVMLRPPVGAVADFVEQRLRPAGLPVAFLTRDWDAAFWPHATAGFFKVKRQIPRVLEALRVGP